MVDYSVPEVGSAIEKKLSEKNKDVTDGEQISISEFKHLFSMQEGKYYYGVQIITGRQLQAGTRADVYVSLVGDKGKTGKLSLRRFFEFFPSVSRDTCENLIIVADEDLGKILVVIIGCDDSRVEDRWYVSVVTVANLQSYEMEQFPCYHWIGEKSHVSITAHTTTRKDVAGSSILLDQRISQLSQRQSMYRWQKFPDSGFPSGIDDTVDKIPPDEQWEVAKNINFTTDALRGIDLKVSGIFRNPDDLHFYEMMADKLGGEKPLYQAGRWTSDVVFGQQMLNGVNPIIIERCEKLPPNFPVTNEMVQPFLDLTLEQEMKAGHIYICDMKVMDDLKAREGYFNVAPICLFYVNKSKQLVPIAIQLKQGVREDEKESNPIFLPSDNWIDWLLAKIYYQSAHSQVHQGFTHYISCHATMEAYAVGTQRNLPDPHPIFKLLRPHFHYTMAINSRARATLINPGGIIDQLFGVGGDGLVQLWKRCGTAYNVHTSSIKYYAKKRGVDNADQLPGYYYRDDGFKVWEALEEYAKDIINEFYKTNQDVVEDKELQAWAYDIHTNGFPGFNGAEMGHGFPDKMVSKEELIHFCTLIMFTGSVQHSSVNYMQYYFYRFVPNAPFGVRLPPPPKKGEIDFQYLLRSLPDKDTTIGSVGTTHLLSQYSDNEIFLGQYKQRFTEKPAKEAIQKFQDTLEDVSKGIKKRNEGLDMKYTGMIPEKIPNSITM